LTKNHATKTNWGSGDIVPCILDLGTRWRWVVSFTPRPLYPEGKSPLDRRVGGPQSRSGHGEQKNSQPIIIIIIIIIIIRETISEDIKKKGNFIQNGRSPNMDSNILPPG
jgi:hypothetical protein